MLRLNDRIAVITGAAMGLGQSMALLFSAEGARVVVADINRSSGEETVRMMTGSVMVVDAGYTTR